MSSQNSHHVGAQEMLLELCFMICKGLNVSILLDYTQLLCHCLSVQENMDEQIVYFRIHNREIGKTVIFFLGNNPFQESPISGLQLHIKLLLLRDQSFRISENTFHYTGYRRIRPWLVAYACLLKRQSVSKDPKEIGSCSCQTGLQASVLKIPQISKKRRQMGNPHRLGHL